jgi:hypothetical protein
METPDDGLYHEPDDDLFLDEYDLDDDDEHDDYY